MPNCINAVTAAEIRIKPIAYNDTLYQLSDSGKFLTQ
jgi:hypothetical protein